MISYDCEVTKYDFLVVFKEKSSGQYFVFHNDATGIAEFLKTMQDEIFAGFNVKNYDRYMVGAIVNDGRPVIVKKVNDFIINGHRPWEYPDNETINIYFNNCDVMDDMQQGLSLKAIEGHLGMDITETDVDFNIDRAWTKEETELMIMYCKKDVDMVEKLLDLRKDYLTTKLDLGRAVGLSDAQALYMTNAKLTAKYLGAIKKEHNDEREYTYPSNLKMDYIPKEVKEFFDKYINKAIPDEEIFCADYKCEISIGNCEIVLGLGGIHGAIPNVLIEEEDLGNYNHRIIRNYDVSSYYPNLMVKNNYLSRNASQPENYELALERKMKSKDAREKAKVKLVLNTTYGASLNQYNELYDPLMGRSVCISGQLYLLELAEHLYRLDSVEIIQVNTDGIMVTYNEDKEHIVKEVILEWQNRTGFILEEDKIKKIAQKDVNNYVEVQEDGKTKIKGGYLVRGIAKAGAFNINNNAIIVADALKEYFVNGTPIEKTIEECNDPFKFMLIAKASSKYSEVFTEEANAFGDRYKVPVQRCNRVYASLDKKLGTLYKVHKETGKPAKIAGLPEHCLIVNDNIKELDVERFVDKSWYIKLAQKQVNDFSGISNKKSRADKAIEDILENL